MGFASELLSDCVDVKYEAFGVSAVYTPPGGGAGVACTIVSDGRDVGQSADDPRPLVGQRTFTVRKSELPSPAFGGVFVLEGGGTFTISNRPLSPDPEGLEWLMWVS
jgi:hypothetical protein